MNHKTPCLARPFSSQSNAEHYCSRKFAAWSHGRRAAWGGLLDFHRAGGWLSYRSDAVRNCLFTEVDKTHRDLTFAQTKGRTGG